MAGVSDQPSGDGDQPSAQGGDHGLAAAYAVLGQDLPAGITNSCDVGSPSPAEDLARAG
jgi:hypothetical protein